jgi:hypothetical protein
VLRHELAREDRPGLLWIGVFAFGAVFMSAVSLVFDPRPGPPRPVYFLFPLLFGWLALRMATVRFKASPAVILERGLFLPAHLPRHWIRLEGRAVAFSDLKRVRIDASSFRSGSHVFETAQGPKRGAKAFFPPPKRLAEEIKRLAPQVEVELIDRRGKGRRYAPAVTRRPRRPKGEKSHAK